MKIVEGTPNLSEAAVLVRGNFPKRPNSDKDRDEQERADAASHIGEVYPIRPGGTH